MVQPLSKLANPWKCDAPGCGILRANDANHWLIVSVRQADSDSGDGPNEVVVNLWTDELAELGCSKHACGVPCALKIVAQQVMQSFFPAEISTGKEVANATD